MTRTEIERLAILETEVASIKETTSRIESKLDDAITCKADRSEVQEVRDDYTELRKLFISVALTIAGFCAATLIAVVLFRVGLK